VIVVSVHERGPVNPDLFVLSDLVSDRVLMTMVGAWDEVRDAALVLNRASVERDGVVWGNAGKEFFDVTDADVVINSGWFDVDAGCWFFGWSSVKYPEVSGVFADYYFGISYGYYGVNLFVKFEGSDELVVFEPDDVVEGLITFFGSDGV
jgi:hypothetical protein